MPETRDLLTEIKQVIDITSRVDERLKIIAEAQQQIGLRLNHLVDEHNALVGKVHVIESKNGNKLHEAISNQEEKLVRVNGRIEVLETVGSQKSQRQIEDLQEVIIKVKERIRDLEEHRESVVSQAKSIMGYIWQGIFIIMICYLLYRMGLSLPPVP
jgi:cell division protein FtsB